MGLGLRLGFGPCLTPSVTLALERALSLSPHPFPNEQAFRDKHWQLCYDLASEAVRLNPTRVAYLGNRAASALKLGQKRHLRQAAEDSVIAYEIDPNHLF